MVVQKIGQFPSLADIANDESKTYRSVLTKRDSSEFHKAIGLATHGVGIGSFVLFTTNIRTIGHYSLRGI
jgi:hypothetical protein